MSEFKKYREESRKGWGTNDDGLSIEQVKLGAILRIADATELMAKRHQELVDAKDSATRNASYWKTQYDAERRRRIAMQGRVTTLNRLLAKTAN